MVDKAIMILAAMNKGTFKADQEKGLRDSIRGQIYDSSNSYKQDYARGYFVGRFLKFNDISSQSSLVTLEEGKQWEKRFNESQEGKLSLTYFNV